MASYFAVQSPQPIRRKTFAQADRLADSMAKKITELDVSLIAVRSLGSDGFVFAVVSRLPLATQTVTSILRRERALVGYSISEESTLIDGPFLWKKEGRHAPDNVRNTP